MCIEAILEINHLSFSYGKQAVLNDLSFVVAKQTVHGILGNNGAGKTTLFDCIFNHSAHPAISLPKGMEQEVAYLQTEAFFYSYMTGREYLHLLCRKASETTIAAWNKLFDLPLDTYAHNYSTGMKKKLNLLGILLLDKKLIILDEPFNGLDLGACETVRYIIQRLVATGKTILLSSHIFETLITNCDAISIMEHGQMEQTFVKADFDRLSALVMNRFRQTVAQQVDRLLP